MRERRFGGQPPNISCQLPSRARACCLQLVAGAGPRSGRSSPTYHAPASQPNPSIARQVPAADQVWAPMDCC